MIIVYIIIGIMIIVTNIIAKWTPEQFMIVLKNGRNRREKDLINILIGLLVGFIIGMIFGGIVAVLTFTFCSM